MADAAETVAVVEELTISSVPLLGFDGSVVRPGLVALLWLRGRELGDHTRPCRDWLIVLGCISYYDKGNNRSTYLFVFSPLKYPLFVG